MIRSAQQLKDELADAALDAAAIALAAVILWAVMFGGGRGR
jgi:hypothetical protein